MVAPAWIVMPKRMYYGTVEEGYLHTRLINSTVVAERNESHDQYRWSRVIGLGVAVLAGTLGASLGSLELTEDLWDLWNPRNSRGISGISGLPGTLGGSLGSLELLDDLMEWVVGSV